MKARLVIEVTYDLNNETPKAMTDTLQRAAEWAVGEGLLTGSTAAEVADYAIRAETNTAPEQDVVCAHCGSNDVVIEGTIRWSVPEQRYEVTDVCDKGHFCKACNGLTRIKDVPIEAS